MEIIVGDKTANDFFIPEDQPFKIIGALPYLYEINLRRFLSRLQYYVNTDQLVVRLWKDEDNSYHLKGMWVDDEWMLLTGNNLNPRAWRLDLENAILIHDPQHELAAQRERELELIRTHTTVVNHYRELQSIADYPVKFASLFAAYVVSVSTDLSAVFCNIRALSPAGLFMEPVDAYSSGTECALPEWL